MRPDIIPALPWELIKEKVPPSVCIKVRGAFLPVSLPPFLIPEEDGGGQRNDLRLGGKTDILNRFFLLLDEQNLRVEECPLLQALSRVGPVRN